MDEFLALLLGYALGSIPFGLLLARAAGKGDIRQVGSGNIVATNVLRTGSKGLAAAVLLFDVGKGFLAVWLAGRWLPDVAALAALGAVLGHCFPLWLGFRGGKGVATTLGVCLGLAWPIGLAYAAVWLAMLAITRISSLSGMAAAVTAPVAAGLLVGAGPVPVLAAIAVIVVVQHRENLARLRARTEPKVGRSQ
jgi:glycerol-3-phosphate acyltransferase PlsY